MLKEFEGKWLLQVIINIHLPTMKKLAVGILVAGLLVGCESSREDKGTARTPPTEYQSMTNPVSQLPGVGTGSPNTSPSRTPPE
jgi:hypothetical protein